MQVKYAMVEPGEGLVYHVDQRHEALGSHKDHHGEQSRRRRECDLPEPPPIPQLCRHELHRHQLHRRDRHHLHLHPRSLGWLLYLSDDGWDEPGGSGSGGQLRAYPRRDVHGCVGSHEGNLQVSSSSAPLA